MSAPPAEIEHYVSTAPFDPYSIEALSAEQEKFYLASQWRMMWWRLKRHKVAVAAGVILLLMYGSVLISEFLAPYNLHTRDVKSIYAPPQSVRFFHEGTFVGPFVYGLGFKLNLENLKREYHADPKKVQRIRFFCTGDTYKYFGVISGNFHFICPATNGTLYIMGTDRLGRDVLSRIIYGTRISLTVGLIGISISFSARYRAGRSSGVLQWLD